jgi:hypothetical protein
VDPDDGDHALLVFSNYNTLSLFSTQDGGLSWVQVAGNLEEFPDGSGSGPSVRWAAIQRYGGAPTYFVGTSTGLYSAQTLDGSSTVWVQEGVSAIGRVVVDMIDVRKADGLVVAATHGRGVFSGTLAANGSGGGTPAIPQGPSSIRISQIPSMVQPPSDFVSLSPAQLPSRSMMSRVVRWPC